MNRILAKCPACGESIDINSVYCKKCAGTFRKRQTGVAPYVVVALLIVAAGALIYFDVFPEFSGMVKNALIRMKNALFS